MKVNLNLLAVLGLSIAAMVPSIANGALGLTLEEAPLATTCPTTCSTNSDGGCSRPANPCGMLSGHQCTCGENGSKPCDCFY